MHLSKFVAVISMALIVSACGEQQARNAAESSSNNAADHQQSIAEQAETSQQPATTEPATSTQNPGKNTQPLQRHAHRAMSKAVLADGVYAAESSTVVGRHPPAPWHGGEPPDRENYLSFSENTVKSVPEHPVSTFSVDVDTAAYSNIRRMLAREGRLPPKNAVKVEEMINYFEYDYPGPGSLDRPFSVHIELAPAPWNSKRHLLQVGLKGFQPPAKQRGAANLVFLIDVSGSMQSQDKLGLVKKSLRLLVNQMQARDRIAIVVYAGAAGMVLKPTTADKKASIMVAIDGLQAGGSTNGGAGIRLAYDLAQQHFVKGGINRVMIASDGDMNVGTISLEALKDLVEEKRKSGIALTTLGFGGGNYNYALMEQLADVGNGNAAYIDSLQEAQKVLVTEMQSTLLTIASDVKIQIEFNPAVVSEYRLIGYENRLLNREDFRNDKVDAGDIGAGHTVTALYEISLAGSGAEMIPARRYGGKRTSTDAAKASEIAFVRLRYKKPDEIDSVEFSRAISRRQLQSSFATASENLRFAASVAGFGQLLRGGKFTGKWSYDDALTLARSAKSKDPHGYRGELIGLIELAKSLTTPSVAQQAPESTGT